MRLPTRRGELLKRTKEDSGPIQLTAGGVLKLQKQLKDLQTVQLPQAIEDVKRTGEFGDFSENAEYQEAKSRMRRIHARIIGITEELKRVSVIAAPRQDGSVQLGSKVTFESSGKQQTFELVGPSEAYPARGRISHLSPLGSLLMGHRAGESVTVLTTGVVYTILEVK